MGEMGAPTAATFLLALLGWLVLGMGPGWLVATALTPSRSALDRLAVSPAVSLGIAYPAAAWTDQLGLPHAPAAALAALVIASAVSGAVLLRRRRDGAGRGAPASWPPSLAPVLVPLVVVVALWVLVLWTSTPGWSAVVPNSDGNTHGLAVVEVIQHGRVMGFAYPLALHLIAALVGSATSVPSALVVPLTILASSWAVLGVASVAHRISARSTRWAALASACLVPFFTYGQVNWGPLPLVVAVALVPAVALIALDLGTRRSVAVAALAIAGLVGVHVTEALVAALLVLLAVAPLGRRAGPRLVRGAVAGVVALVLVAPLVGELLRGGAGRPSDPGPSTNGSADMLTAVFQPFVAAVTSTAWVWLLLLLGAAVLLAVSAVGAWAFHRDPLGRAVGIVVVACLVLAGLASAARGGVITSPWYGNGDRLVAQAAALLPILLGLGIEVVRRRVGGRAIARPVVAIVGVAAVLASAQSVLVARQGLDRFSVVTAADRDAFRWLEGRVRPGELVLNDHRDGSVWMVEASGGIDQPVFAGKPGGGFEAQPEWADRLYLRNHVAQIDTDPRVRAIASTWNVRYVFSGERTFADAPRLVDADALATAPGVTEVFRSGDARIFELPAR